MDQQMMMSHLLGSQQGPPPEAPPPQAPPAGGDDWLAAAINAVHSGMVSEQDPKQVSALGAILNLLTTFQQNAMAPPKNG